MNQFFLFDYQAYILEIKSGCECKFFAACEKHMESDIALDPEILATCPFYQHNLDVAMVSSPFDATTLPDQCTKAIEFYRYEQAFGKQDNIPITETVFYKDYLSVFKMDEIEIAIPDDLKQVFDWDLLFKLCCASLSSDYCINANATIPTLYEFVIFVKTETDESISRAMHELFFGQILRLYEVYVQECLTNLLIQSQDYREYKMIRNEQQLRITKFNQLMEKIQCRNQLLKWIK